MSRSYFKEYLTVQEERRLFRAMGARQGLTAERDLAWMQALRYTGVRIDAFSRLTVRHALQVVKTYYLTLEPAIQKRKKGHSIYVCKRGRQAFDRLLKIRRRQGHELDQDAPLVLSRKGGALSVRGYQDRCNYWDSEAGLDLGLSPHWFRHTLAKHLMKTSESADPQLIVMAALGHSDRRSTDIYTWPDKEDMELELERAA